MSRTSPKADADLTSTFEDQIGDSLPPTPPPEKGGRDTLSPEEKFWEKQKEIENKGLEEFFTLRRKWSKWIIIWITALIAFSIVLTVAVGFGLLNFLSYQWFITSVTVETFLQIVGMGYIAVKFLFSSGQQP